MNIISQFPRESSNGSFKRQKSIFRSIIDEESQYKPEKGRYHLYLSYACPWAHRTLIVRELKELDAVVSVSFVNPIRDDKGWSISTRDYYNSNPESNTGGTHGYDPAFLSMHGIFLAYGPAFKDGLIVPSFQNIHIYELIANVLGIEPAVTDGSLDSVSAMLE